MGSVSIVPVVLSGGSGTRLWPLSRQLRPKQLLPLVSERTMLQETMLRALRLGDSLLAPIVICNADQRFLVAEQMRQIGAAPQAIVLEPAGRNTAPAVAIAALLALREGDAAKREHSDEVDDPLLLVLPADHVISDVEAFVQAVAPALDAAAAGYLVTFGVVPERPETGYGYLRKGAAGMQGQGWYHLERFVEKPDALTAQRYVESGQFLWNSGIFLFSARRYLEELERHAPEIAACCSRAAADLERDQDFTRLGSEFLQCPSDSIDYAVMEKAERAALVPLDAGWSDVGSWDALYEVLGKDEDGNVLRGDVYARGCRNSYISSNSRLVTAVGVEDYVIVETGDALLVMPRRCSQEVKDVVEKLKETSRVEIKGASSPM